MPFFIKKYRKRILLISAAAVLLVSAYLARNAQAVFNPDTSIHIDAQSIEDSTLIIGTHLIYLGALNESVYQIAVESAEDSSQSERYYKSELAGGRWYNISSASSLSDIMEEGELVEDDEIHELYMTHHTKSDGITYDLRTNKPVCIYNIRNHYDLENMPELEPLKTQYGILGEDAEKELELVEKFFKTKTLFDEEKEEATVLEKANSKALKQLDNQILSLQDYYLVLKNNEAPAAESDAVMKVMDKVDASRQQMVCMIVEEAAEVLESEITGLSEINDALLSAIGESRQNLEDSLKEHEANMLKTGEYAAAGMEYRVSMELIENAEQHRHSDCDRNVTVLIHLSNILDGSIVSRTGEISVLNELIPEQEENYLTLLERGASSEYNKAVEEGASHALLENIMKSNRSELNSCRSELQFYVQSRLERMETEPAQDYIKEKIAETGRFASAIAKDDYEANAYTTVEEYREWLQERLNEFAGESEESELDDLYARKDALELEKLTALDNQKVREAKKIDAQIQELVSEIEKKESAIAEQLARMERQRAVLEASKAGLTDTQDIDNEIADLGMQISTLQTELAQAGDSQDIKNIQELKQEALDIVREGRLSEDDLENLSTYTDGLINILDSGSALALQAVKDVYKEMMTQSMVNNLSAYDDMLSELETAVENSNVIKPEISSVNGLSASRTIAVLEDALGIKLPAAVSSAAADGRDVGGNANQADDDGTGSGTSSQGGSGGISGQGGSGGQPGSGTSGGGTGGQGGSGTSGQPGSGTSGQLGSGTSGQGGSGTSGQPGSGTSGGESGGGTSGQGGSGTSGQPGSGTSGGESGGGTSGQGGSGTSGQPGSGTSGGGTGGGTSGQPGSGTSGGESGSGTSGQGDSGTSGQPGSGTSGGESGGGTSGQGGSGSQPDSGTSVQGGSGSQPGSGTSGGESGSGTSGQGGSSGSQPDSGTSVQGGSGSQPGSGTSGGESGSGTSGQPDSGTSGQGGSGTSGQPGSGTSGGESGGGTSGQGGSGSQPDGGTSGSGTSGQGGSGSQPGSGTSSSGTNGQGGSGSQPSGGTGSQSGSASQSGSGASDQEADGTGSQSGEESDSQASGQPGGITTGVGKEDEDDTDVAPDTIASVIIAVAEYGEQTGSKELKNLAAGLAGSQMKVSGTRTFEVIQNRKGTFAPATILAEYLNYRYLWNDTKKTAVIAKGSAYYSFTAYRSRVLRGNDKTDEMSVPAEFHSVVYIPEDYLYQEFECRIYVIPKSDMALLIDDETLEKSEELLSILQEEGGK